MGLMHPNKIPDARKVVKAILAGTSLAEIFVDAAMGDWTLDELKQIESSVRSETRNPIAKMEEAGKASILSYDVPASSTYKGRNFIVLDHPGLSGEAFDWVKAEYKGEA